VTPVWTIETLSLQPGREKFDCGQAEMNEWLSRYARRSDKNGQTLTRLALHPDDGRIVYYAMKSSELRGDDLQSAFA